MGVVISVCCCNTQTDAAAVAHEAWFGSGSGSQDAIAAAEKAETTATHVAGGRGGDRCHMMLLIQPHLQYAAAAAQAAGGRGLGRGQKILLMQPAVAAAYIGCRSSPT